MSPAPSPISDSDDDYGFDEDMEALRRACTMTGRNSGAADAGEESDPDSSAGSTGNDLDLLHRVQERFSVPASSADPLSVVTHTLPCRTSDSDNDDDLETLRIIQRRFQQYESDAVYRTTGNHLEEDEAVPTAVTTGRETLDTLSKSRKCITPSEEFPDFATTGSHHAEDMHNLSVKTLAYTQFSNSALYIVEALRKNRSCQKFMRRKLIEIESKIEENKELRGRVKCLMDFQAACNRNTGRMLCQEKDPRIRLISSRKSRTDTPKNRWKKFPALYFGPAENSHVSKYRTTMERFPISLRKLPWSNIENDNLVKGLKQQYQEMVMLNLMNIESGLGSPGDTNSAPAVSSSDYEVTSEKIRSFLPLVNWDRLASLYLTGRSGAECESRWLNCLDPRVNFSPWTIEEDKKLLYIVQKRGVFNWIDIAIGMGKYRTPFQCLLRYQRSLNPHILNRDWTKEDDAKLRLAVEAFGYDWQVVASNVEGRSGPQCSNRWRQCLHPERKKVGRWSVDEDKCLKVAVMLFGAKNWNKIALFASGRTQAQCRERWLNCLDPSLNLEPWTQEEDDKLLAALLKHGHCWSKVAACVPPRTDNQCRRRWKVLRPHEVPLLQATKKIKRTVLISNFVGRESERPLIGPSDFSIPALPAAEDANNKADRRKTSSCDVPNKSEAKPKRSLKKKSEADGMVNSCSEIAPGDPSLIPGVNSTTGEVGSFKKIREETSRDTVAKGSTTKSRGSLDKTFLVDGVNSSSGTASGDLFVVPTVNTITTDRASTSGTKKKTSRSSARPGSSLEYKSTADGTINQISEIGPDLSRVPDVSHDTAESVIMKRTRKRTSSDLPKTSRAKSGSSIEEKLNANAIIKSPLSSDNLPIISGDKYGSFLEEKVTPEALINSSSGVALGDVPCVSSAATDSGSLKRSRKKTSRSRAKSGSSLGETITADAMINCSSMITHADLSTNPCISPNSAANMREWLTEVNYLGQLQHPNLVKLIGYCLDGDNRLLVYEFMPKGSLENHLFRRAIQTLSWAVRIKIAVGAARGLAFLHDAEPQVIYRDVKAANILLDLEFDAKLSDFGLAKDGPTGDLTHVSTQVMGTHGYAAPEYLATGRLSAKADVYSFGVMLLELISGRRALDKQRPKAEQSLVDWAKHWLGNKRKMFRIMDPRLEGQYPKKGAFAVAAIVLQCLSSDSKSRPSMSEVLESLEQLQDPKLAVKSQQNPPFLLKRDR